MCAYHLPWIPPSKQRADLQARERPGRFTLDAHANELGIRHDLATASILDSAHEKNRSVSVWTVDKPADIRRMIELRVDRIITNYSDIAGDLAGRRQPEG